MPSLVAKRTDVNKKDVWGVLWMWFPHFLAEDQILRRFVDKKMTEMYQGEDGALEDKMFLSKTVIKLICERYPMVGLREALEAILAVDPTLTTRLKEKEPETKTPFENATGEIA